MLQRIVFPFIEGYLTITGFCLAIALCLGGLYALFTWDVITVINELKHPVVLVIAKIVNAVSVLYGLFYVAVTNLIKGL